MNKYLITTALLMVIGVTLLFASPAKPVLHQLFNPDGSSITAFLRGDERGHFFETTDGVMICKNEADFYTYAELNKEGVIIPSSVVASMPETRSQAENLYANKLLQSKLRQAFSTQLLESVAKWAPAANPGEIKKEFPTKGQIKGLVILAEYQDIKFSENATKENYDQLMNQTGYSGDIAAGSVKDYFYAQSSGQLELDFDVVGPVTLSKKRAYYGSAAKTGRENVSEMVEEAVKLARIEAPEIDFSGYDANNDGEVDFIYVIYAGYGESQGGPEESVWPQSSSLSYLSWDLYDGLYLGKYACSCELKGNKDAVLDGIGTFCHEFSHILGLPDIYDPNYSGCAGMGKWDVMDIGSYNNDSKTPAGYTAMDRYSLGWLTPVLLEGSKFVELPALSESNQALFLVSEKNPNEYFTFENRQQIGWDAALPGHGLLISHIEYDKNKWAANIVNTNGYERVRLVAADNRPAENTAGNLFPGSKNITAFTDDSNPAMEWNNADKVRNPITEISEQEGLVYFNFNNAQTAISVIKEKSEIDISLMDDGVLIRNPESRRIIIYDSLGVLYFEGYDMIKKISLKKGLYIINGKKVICN